MSNIDLPMLFHTQEVRGSSPCAPTIFNNLQTAAQTTPAEPQHYSTRRNAHKRVLATFGYSIPAAPAFAIVDTAGLQWLISSAEQMSNAARCRLETIKPIS